MFKKNPCDTLTSSSSSYVIVMHVNITSVIKVATAGLFEWLGLMGHYNNQVNLTSIVL